jgi:flagellar motor switch protein FliM
LLRKISVSWDSHPRGPAEWRDRLQKRLLECPFTVQLGVNGLRASVNELSQMEAGTLLPLRRGAAQPASLGVGGVDLFAAIPVRRGEKRAAQLLAMNGDSSSMPEKETKAR